ncbi:MAG: hypothetical protein LBB88_10470 [Planctomycetaceae bacterium]|jgi:predicted GH43/DUF377 family glycosyl hydrolase|nr:hypothetical protein [Planctomycetaceae bacterium]
MINFHNNNQSEYQQTQKIILALTRLFFVTVAFWTSQVFAEDISQYVGKVIVNSPTQQLIGSNSSNGNENKNENDNKNDNKKVNKNSNANTTSPSTESSTEASNSSSNSSANSSANGSTQWVKYEKNPVLGGGDLGTIFDISIIKENDEYKMYNSWRPKGSIALSTSKDGKEWTKPKIVLSPIPKTWERDINRPGILKKDGVYHLWYTGQAQGKSRIGYATSSDGINFTRQSEEPVLKPELSWEKVAVMCPHVNWDEDEKVFKMWYSAGEQYEPNAIGYATSKDGLVWKKYDENPVFKANPEIKWEKHKVTACQIIKRKNDYLMFYIGFQTEDLAQIGIAKSPDGIKNWTRYKNNPIIAPTPNEWDANACYKPFVIQENDKWLLWYNGRNKGLERIGLAIFNNNNLGF